MLLFNALVGSRSSTKRVDGPPGEAEVLELNPQRRATILAATGWNHLVPGALNLEVAPEAVDRLLLCTPLIRESGDDVRYSPPYAHIPKFRVGYLYYKATIRSGDRTASIPIRRAVNPIKTRLEAFSDQRLRESLDISDGDSVTCEVDDFAANPAPRRLRTP